MELIITVKHVVAFDPAVTTALEKLMAKLDDFKAAANDTRTILTSLNDKVMALGSEATTILQKITDLKNGIASGDMSAADEASALTEVQNLKDLAASIGTAIDTAKATLDSAMSA